jgi:tetratricopeptide (TPR) repeat protein
VNHNHFAGLMELIVPVGLGYAIDRFNAIPGRGKTVWRRFISRMSLPASSKILLLFFMLIVILSAVFLTLSRAGIVGMLSAFLLMAALFLVRSRTKRWVRHLGLTILIGFLFLTWFGLGPILERMATLKDLSGALEDRVQVWRDSLGIIRDSPVWGTGLGTFEAVFPAYRTATDDLAYAHAHNDYIQLAAETGLLGIVIVLGGTVIIFIKAIRALRIRRPQTPWRRGILIGGIGAIGAIAVHSAMDFNLHIPANALVLTAVIALIWNLSDAPLPSYPTSHVSPFPSHRSRFTSILIAVSVLSVVYLGYMAARQFITDRSYQRGRAHEASGNLEDALAAYRIAADRDGLNADYPLALARVHEKISEQTSIPPDERETHLNHALALLDRAATLGPTLPEPRLHRGWTHAALGHPEKAEADFAELIRLDPTNPNVQYYVGLWYAATGRADAAREMARKLRSAGRESKAEEIEQMVSRT